MTELLIYKRKIMYRTSFSICICIFMTTVLFAQSPLTPSALSGRVLDNNSAVIVGATVDLEYLPNKAERSSITNDQGTYHFDNLKPGNYRIKVSKAGFSTVTQEVTVSSQDKLVLDLVLLPGSIAEAVNINATSVIGTDEAIRNIPGSIETIDLKTLENSRVFTSTEALRKVSGINVREEEGFGLRPNVGIRGLNPTRSTKVLLLEDGLPLTFAPYGDNASYYHPPIDRFERIEVLKGAGQIMYGPSTVGGVINFITPNPPTKPAGSITLIGGNRDYFNGHISYGGTLGNTGLLFDYMRKQGEGSRENLRSGLNDFNFKSVTTITPKQALMLKGNYYGEDSNITYSGLTETEYRANPRQNPFRNDYFYGDRFGLSATHSYVFNSNTVLTTNLYGSSFKRHWWRQSSNSGQRPNRIFNGSNPDPDCRGMATLNTTCGNEGRLRKYLSGGVESRLRIDHGLFGLKNETNIGVRAHFEDQNRRQLNGDLPTSRTGSMSEHNERKNQAYSSFIQNRFIFKRLAITPGVRVEHIEYERTNKLTGARGRSELNYIIPGLGISFNPSSNTTIFAGVHRGFAPPRTEDIINNNGGSLELDPELSWNYELGFRSLIHRGVRIDATVFRMDYENQIVPASLAGGVGSLLTNGGQTLHQGFEISSRIDTGIITRSPHNVYLRTAYTYLPTAKFTGVRYSTLLSSVPVNISGNRLPYAPEHTLQGTLGYSHPSGFDSLVEAVYVGKQLGDERNFIAPSANGQLGIIPSYVIWNATANYDVEQLHTTFFFTVKNLFDRTYIADRARGILPGSPRLLQAGLKFRF
jgi:Fe(3+) dicitrate transport protein